MSGAARVVTWPSTRCVLSGSIEGSEGVEPRSDLTLSENTGEGPCTWRVLVAAVGHEGAGAGTVRSTAFKLRRMFRRRLNQRWNKHNRLVNQPDICCWKLHWLVSSWHQQCWIDMVLWVGEKYKHNRHVNYPDIYCCKTPLVGIKLISVLLIW